MKQVLFATSALVALSGAAAAEVSLKGDARLGMRYSDSLECATCTDGTRSGWNVVSRARVQFVMTGETDSGLSFGARFRAHEADGARNYTRPTGVVWVEGAYGRLEAGDVDSAIEKAVGDLPGVGLTGLGDYNEFQYTSTDRYGMADNKGLVYSYTFGDATVYASFMDQYAGVTGNEYSGDAWSLGVGYKLGQHTFGIGYSSDGVTVDPITGNVGAFKSTTWGISGGTEWNGFTFKAVYIGTKAKPEGADNFDIRQYGLGAEYQMANGVGLSGFYRHVKTEYVGKADITGIGATYDLGGGASVRGGIVHRKVKWDATGVDNSTYTDADFGLNFTF